MTSRDRLFLNFMRGMFIILMLYGTGMTITFLSGVSDNLARSLVSGFASMFAGVIGLGSGYILGTTRENGNGGKDSNGNHS